MNYIPVGIRWGS